MIPHRQSWPPKVRRVTGDIDGLRYKLWGRKGAWLASVWCECVLGPHFHDLGVYYMTQRDALEVIAMGAEKR